MYEFNRGRTWIDLSRSIRSIATWRCIGRCIFSLLTLKDVLELAQQPLFIVNHISYVQKITSCVYWRHKITTKRKMLFLMPICQLFLYISTYNYNGSKFDKSRNCAMRLCGCFNQYPHLRSSLAWGYSINVLVSNFVTLLVQYIIQCTLRALINITMEPNYGNVIHLNSWLCLCLRLGSWILHISFHLIYHKCWVTLIPNIHITWTKQCMQCWTTNGTHKCLIMWLVTFNIRAHYFSKQSRFNHTKLWNTYIHTYNVPIPIYNVSMN